MKLKDWMRRKHLDDEELAALMNKGLPPDRRCSARAVRKWKYGERKPPADKIARLEDVTRKRVALRDWIDDPREKGRAA